MVDLNKPAPEKNSRFSEEIIQDCLRVLKFGDVEDLFEIIPRIGVIRDSRFHQHLLALLDDEDTKRREFAAYAMGAMGNLEFLDRLKKAFMEAERMKGPAWEELQVAVIEAIGAIGDDAAMEFFLPVLRNASEEGKGSRKLRKLIVESIGAIAQQGGNRSLAGLLELTRHKDPDLRAQAISEISVAYWHRPNEIPDLTLQRIYGLTRDRHQAVAESAVAALQSLADVGCRRAERFFFPKGRK